MKNRRTRGFTLIELMVAVAIVGILAGIAYPSYQQQVRKSRRADAKAALANAAALQERWFTEHNSYTGTITNIGGNESKDKYYTISVTNPSCTSGSYISCFKVTATAKGAQLGDTKCATLSLDNTGSKTSTGGGTDCW